MLQTCKKHFRQDVQNKLRQEKQDLATMRRKCRATKKINQEQMKFLRQKDNEIQQKAFRIEQLNSGIEYLKEHCNTAGNQSLGTQKNKMSSTGKS